VIKESTGISDSYEPPINTEIVINSSGKLPKELIDEIYSRISQLGYI